MTSAGGSAFCSWTSSMTMPVPYSTISCCSISRARVSIERRPSVVTSMIGVWPMISRMTLSAAAFTVASGSRTLNR